jgi:GAF domain-containing protein
MHIHPRESERLAALRSANILDSVQDHAFDRIVFQAAQVVRTPIAKINLIDEHRQWSKAYVGKTSRELPRSLAFCSFTILQTDPLIVPDTHHDSRFHDNPLVTGNPFIRFYVGIPLTSPDALPLGSLCAIDMQPRSLIAEQIKALLLLARETEMLIFGRDELSSCGAERTIFCSDAKTTATQK